jgi:hypothetical protein
MVVVVADPAFEERRRSSRLNAPDDAFRDQDAERVIDRLQGDCTDAGPDDLGHAVGRDVGISGDRTQNGQPLGGDLNTPLAEEIGGVGGHGIV